MDQERGEITGLPVICEFTVAGRTGRIVDVIVDSVDDIGFVVEWVRDDDLSPAMPWVMVSVERADVVMAGWVSNAARLISAVAEKASRSGDA